MKSKLQPTLFAEPQLAMFDKSPEQIALEKRAIESLLPDAKEVVLCPRCKRPATGWPLVRPDVCSPTYWVNCIRSPELIISQGLSARAAADFSDYRDAGGAAYSCQQAWDEAV